MTVNVKTGADGEGFPETLKAKSCLVLTSAKYRGGGLDLTLIDKSGTKEELSFDTNSPNVKVLNDSQMIVEIK